MDTEIDNQSVAVHSPKFCPFCGDFPSVTRLPDGAAMEVRCGQCGATLKVATTDYRTALAIWDRRCYPWTKLGGKATLGLSTKRKRRSSRRNLRRGRLLRRVRLAVDKWQSLREQQRAIEEAFVADGLRRAQKEMPILEARAKKYPEVYKIYCTLMEAQKAYRSVIDSDEEAPEAQVL